MSLLRASLFFCFITIDLVFSGFALAEDKFTAGLPSTTEAAPAWLPSGRDVKIELAPEAMPFANSNAQPISESTLTIAKLSDPQLGSPIGQSIELAPEVDSDNKIEFIPESDTDVEINTEPSPQWLRPNVEKSSNESTNLTANSLWTRIRNGFAMREVDSILIGKHEQWYASRPEYVKRMTERARRYLYFITTEVEKRGMPSEIALLPMIESAFNPGALSSTRASGIWQFMPATGKNFGLKQNWWHDDRRNVISATNGALDYLQKLHDMFGDWELALAAYNWGEGSVQRAQIRNKRLGLPTDYASLRMPAETRNYIPKLIAIKNIIADPMRFALTLQDIPDQPYFATLPIPKHMDVKLAAELAEISVEEFTALNPEHNRPVILQRKNDEIMLPVDKVETFRTNLENYDKPLVSWQAYQPQRGERLDKLAPRFGLSLANLKSVNGLSARGNTSNGQTLLVPLNGEESDGEFEAFNMHLAPINAHVSSLKHKVRRGESYSSIAHRYHVSVAQLKRLNRSYKVLRSGQTITVALATKSRKHAGRYALNKNKGRNYALNKNTSRGSVPGNHMRKTNTKVATPKRRIARG